MFITVCETVSRNGGSGPPELLHRAYVYHAYSRAASFCIVFTHVRNQPFPQCYAVDLWSPPQRSARPCTGMQICVGSTYDLPLSSVFNRVYVVLLVWERCPVSGENKDRNPTPAVVNQQGAGTVLLSRNAQQGHGEPFVCLFVNSGGGCENAFRALL